MIIGAHFLLYSKNPEADRKFFRDVLQFRAVDAGEGWLIFALPPAEMGIHPSSEVPAQLHAEHNLLGTVLYLMCDDLPSFVKSLQAKNVQCTEIEQAGWGIKTTIKLPSGGEIGLYQPRHPTAINLS
jgi:Glyoxalase/Bleomycin resistance protein/Dioxygenase superfamily